MHMPATPLLEACAITTGYGPSTILRNVSLSIGQKETVGLLGRNGMGKTTLLRTLFGLLPPGPGTVHFAGRDLTGARPAAVSRAGMALVPEGRGIFPNLTVLENLTMAARTGADGRLGWTLARIFELFPRLAERRRNWGDQLSGGEQQMLSIGRALMTNPSLIALDEATEGLAPRVREEIWETLKVVAAEGVSIIVIDKNLDDLFALANRHIILSKGEVVFSGSGAELQGDPALIDRWLGV